ncbi:c-type cytochrome [Salinispirillum sp. LH 10-3-1]|uniref:cytochrome-c oxidase n=1 Tax=Salinispirillum sp. LH 10-3-1 TaxID=2952525 RepID=A0AB38YGF1_9GAMM
MNIVIAIVVLVVATVLFHFLSPWWFTPIASNWGAIDTTINITFIITGVVFVIVNLFMAYAIYRFRYQKERKAHYEPESKKLEAWLTGLTALGIAALLAPGLVVWGKFVSPPEDAMTVEVVGRQWHWMYRFPGEDGVLGVTDPRLVSEENPFGISPQDPAGRDDILIVSNTLHLPLHQPIKMKMRSQDVLHNFAVPEFRAKMDMVPGMVTTMWMEPTRIGNFEVVCMQLCGMAHHAMRGRVVVQEVEDFTQWLNSHPTFAETQTEAYWGSISDGQALYATCAGCHGQNGEGVASLQAPRLSGLERGYLQRQLRYYRDGVRGMHEADTAGQQMAAMMVLLPDDDAIRDVVAYISTLPEIPAPPTIEGNVARGATYYDSCKDCHGSQGEGNHYTRAPRLAGQHDWYLARQLANFHTGVRGSHAGDDYGSQMRLFAQRVQNREAFYDLMAYINSLEPANRAD